MPASDPDRLMEIAASLDADDDPRMIRALEIRDVRQIAGRVRVQHDFLRQIAERHTCWERADELCLGCIAERVLPVPARERRGRQHG